HRNAPEGRGPMRFRLHVVLMITLFCFAAGPSGVRAAVVIVSNLNEPHSLWDTIKPFVPGVQAGFEAAQEFTTGPKDYDLARNLGNLDLGTKNDFTLTATLQADSNGTPGSVLTGFSYDLKTIPTVGFAHVGFRPPSPIHLTSGAKYWLVLNGSSSDGSGSVAWS